MTGELSYHFLFSSDLQSISEIHTGNQKKVQLNLPQKLSENIILPPLEEDNLFQIITHYLMVEWTDIRSLLV